jgi:hypothetical protein
VWPRIDDVAGVEIGGVAVQFGDLVTGLWQTVVECRSAMNGSAVWGSLWLVTWVSGNDIWADNSELANGRLIFELENKLRKEKKYINFLLGFNIRGCNLVHLRFVSNLLIANFAAI